MTPPPPSATLFPYTTLFRSQPCPGRLRSTCQRGPRQSGRADSPRATESPPVHVDRKSTRLNSSHSQISYAVFCLKKKSIVPQKIRPPERSTTTRGVPPQKTA